jgi:hypothetical protein
MDQFSQGRFTNEDLMQVGTDNTPRFSQSPDLSINSLKSEIDLKIQ